MQCSFSEAVRKLTQLPSFPHAQGVGPRVGQVQISIWMAAQDGWANLQDEAAYRRGREVSVSMQQLLGSCLEADLGHRKKGGA